MKKLKTKKLSTLRVARRKALLDAAARKAGYKSWSAVGTAVLHGRIEISEMVRHE